MHVTDKCTTTITHNTTLQLVRGESCELPSLKASKSAGEAWLAEKRDTLNITLDEPVTIGSTGTESFYLPDKTTVTVFDDANDRLTKQTYQRCDKDAKEG